MYLIYFSSHSEVEYDYLHFKEEEIKSNTFKKNYDW